MLVTVFVEYGVGGSVGAAPIAKEVLKLHFHLVPSKEQIALMEIEWMMRCQLRRYCNNARKKIGKNRLLLNYLCCRCCALWYIHIILPRG